MQRSPGPAPTRLDPPPAAAAVLDAVALPLLQIDAAGQLVFANAAARALNISSDDWAAWLPPLGSVPVGRPAVFDLPLPQARQGSMRVHASTLGDAPGGGWLLTLQPINMPDELQAARQQVQRLQELLDVARDYGRLGLWERDARTLEGHWDRQVLKFRGLPDDAPTPRFEDSLAQVAAADREALERVFRESLRRPGSYSHRYSLRAPDGTLRRVHSQWRVLAGPGGLPTRAVGVLLDDTDTLALAGASGEIESQLALAVDMGRIAIWRHDLQTQRMQYNAQAWSVLDMPPLPEGLHIDEVRALIHPDDLPAVLASAQVAVRSDKPTDMEARYRRSDGSWRHVLTRRVVQRDAQGRPLAFLGVAMDVTERRDAEIALRSAAERAALVTRAAGLGTWEVDLRDGSTFWDDQMWTLRGLMPQARAMTPEERMAVVHPDDRARMLALNDLISEAEGQVDAEFRVLWPDGQVHWLATRSKTLRDADGLPTRRMGVNWDVTDARNAAAMRQERELARLESAAKSQFMARMSHELRTPLNAVIGFTQLLMSQENGSAPAIDAATRVAWLRHAQDAGQHLLALIDDLLELADLDSGGLRLNPTPIPPPVLLHPLPPPLPQTLPQTPPQAPAPWPGTPQVTLQTHMMPLNAAAAATPHQAAAPAAATPQPVAQPQAPQPAATGPRKLLYIEDNPVNAMIIAELLARRDDLVLHMAADGSQGVAMARSLLPDLVLLDMQLPDIDGLEVMQRLQAQPATAQIPCVALSANAMPEDIEKALRGGACDYWTKPLDFRAFMAALDKLLGPPST